MTTPFFQGFGTGGGLIAAIGAQNAFVLSQGVRRNHHLIIALVCIICDAIFITAGVAGFGTVVSKSPTLSQVVSLGRCRVSFFLWVGISSFRPEGRKHGCQQPGGAVH
jgi:L-lysine exporter family protein LysE/ArgO